MKALNCQWLLTALSRSSCCLSLRRGDYPKLPDRSQQERDPWYEWDHPDLRLNWGETVRKPLPISLSLHVLKFARTLFSSCSTFFAKLFCSRKQCPETWDPKFYVWHMGWNGQKIPESCVLWTLRMPCLSYLWWSQHSSLLALCLGPGSQNIAPRKWNGSVKPCQALAVLDCLLS